MRAGYAVLSATTTTTTTTTKTALCRLTVRVADDVEPGRHVKGIVGVEVPAEDSGAETLCERRTTDDETHCFGNVCGYKALMMGLSPQHRRTWSRMTMPLGSLPAWRPVCVRVCMRACVCVCVCVCLYSLGC